LELGNVVAPLNDTKAKLLDAAAALVQVRGYNGFSFHDLASAIGIRTASIHYHFPTKGDLALALAERYTADFMTRLGSPTDGTPRSRLTHYISAFADALQQGRMCLCGMIGAEIESVPEPVAAQVRIFFERNVLWLGDVLARDGLKPDTARRQAQLILSALEGAMLIARTSADRSAFDDVATTILSLHKGQQG
jgi:TetR/AcrR family transcriptional regulator, transcriptional repressor for nem operon